MAISNTPGADLRQSRSLQSLNRFTPAGINALAASALILFDAVNAGALIVNDQVEPVLATRTRTLLERLYTLQDAIFGNSDQLPAALAGVVELADGEVRRG